MFTFFARRSVHPAESQRGL
jgi:hypothetical protein